MQFRELDFVCGKWETFILGKPITLEARIGRKVRIEFAARGSLILDGYYEEHGIAQTPSVMKVNVVRSMREYHAQ